MVVAVAVVVLVVVNSLPGCRDRSVSAPDYIATIKTNYGDMRIRLLTSQAPNTVDNFVRLARDKFYDGLSFFEVVKPMGVLIGGRPLPGREPKWTIPQEQNNVPFDRGTVAMWHPESEPDGNRCIFMIGLDARPGFEANFTRFGRVVGGMDVLEKIANVETTGEGGNLAYTPLEQVTIRTITVEEAK